MRAMPSRTQRDSPVHQPVARDAALDRLLRALPAEDAGLSDACLDPEAAAALADGGLSATERTAALAHVATCGHCQALLGALIRTEPPAPPVRAWWQVSWPWLVPALASGLALTIWIAVDRAGPRATVVPVQAPVVQEKEVSPLPDVAPGRAETQVPLDPPQYQALERKAMSPRQATDATTALDSLRGQARDRVDAPDAEAQAVRIETAKPPAAVAGNVAPAVQGFAAGRPAPPIAPPDAVPASPPSAKPSSESVVVGESAAPFGRAGPLRVSGASVAVEITSSDPRIRWRIAGSAVEHSTDGGTTWTPQAVGVSGRLTAGSAPLPEVCWIVGDAGTVVVTVDGLSWTRLSFPVTAPLAAVAATSADAAAVTTSGGQVFTTVDRGKTWR